MKLIFTGMAVGLLALSVQAQNQELFSVNGHGVSAEEFKAVYNKNREVGQNIDPKTPEEYLELYINFKLKVEEAKSMGLDTLARFRREFEGYRKQLAQPYLMDRNADEDLMKEAYDRMKEEVRASHIMVELAPDALPADTLKAWNTLMEYRNRIQKGESFEKLAEQYSKDTYSAKQGGDLGFFTVFNMVYPFESACYTLKPGELSKPVRSQFGYHLIKVTERRPARGTVQVAHIMVVANEKSNEEQMLDAEKKIQEIYQKLKNGGDFANLARIFSDDKTTASNGGMLQPFGINTMVEPFENAAFALANNGDISEPVKTQYGWHILKRIDRKDLQPYEELKDEIKSKVARDTRSNLGTARFIARLKSEYRFSEKTSNLAKMIGLVDTALLSGKWNPSEKELAKLAKRELFVLDGKTYTAADYAQFLISIQGSGTKSKSVDQVVYALYPTYVNQEILAYEESRLADKYPDYKLLVQEYHDGILLFDLTEDRIWNRSIKDTAGLEAFYDVQKSNYMWPERVEADIFSCSTLKLAQQVQKMLKKGKTAEVIQKELNQDSKLNVQLKSGKFAAKDHPVLASVEWKAGISSPTENNDQVVVVNIHKVLPAEPKKLDEIRGLITSDYQRVLEEQWLQELRAKYPVSINQEVKNTVLNSLK